MAIILQQSCVNTADYTDTSIPVTIELISITPPGPDQLQTFCYTVTQVEEPTALSHWVLGICPTLTEEDLGEVTVTINGEEQNVVIGDNVEIFNPPATDPGGACSGIKFDFGLEEAGDTMTVCFELLTPQQVGPNLVCVTGGGQTLSSEFICGPVCAEGEQCETTVFQTMEVCVPVTVTPFADTGTVDVTCCGEATVSAEPCPAGEPSCTFYVTQNICVEVPVFFRATGNAGTATATCGDLSTEGCDCDGDGEID
ncbi:MAG: hypothetical protein AAGU76_00310 [Sedimentibacter sp.]|uniref:hypothetical protein n=1 Tax=Sedimentibacter sp. TaxID=1960295 RepID=UPI003158C5CC